MFCNSGHDTYNGGELKVSRSLNYIELRPCPAEYGYKINCESSWDLILESDTESLSWFPLGEQKSIWDFQATEAGAGTWNQTPHNLLIDVCTKSRLPHPLRWNDNLSISCEIDQSNSGKRYQIFLLPGRRSCTVKGWRNGLDIRESGQTGLTSLCAGVIGSTRDVY